MNREQIGQWDFVIAAYALGIAVTLAMIVWSLIAMQRAEKRRDAVKRGLSEGTER